MVRFKNRYVTVEVNYVSPPKTPPETRDLLREILKTVQILHGDFGCAAVRSGLSASYCNVQTRIAIIRTRLGAHKLLTSSLPFVTKVGGDSVSIRMLYVGGTLRHCYRRVMIHQKSELAKVLPKLAAGKQPNDLEKSFLTLGGFLSYYKRPTM